MQYKALNCYRIIHKDGTEERINAETAVQAIENMTTEEEVSPVISLSMLEEDIRTVIPEEQETPESPKEPDTPPEGDTEIGGEVNLGDGK